MLEQKKKAAHVLIHYLDKFNKDYSCFYHKKDRMSVFWLISVYVGGAVDIS